MNSHSSKLFFHLFIKPAMKTVNKHGKIITAAIKVFAKKGFFNARISDIAKEAKVADGTIYLYFDNKFDILLSVLEEEIGKLTEQIKKAIADETDPERMLEIFARKHLTAMKKNKNLAEVIQVELRQNDKLVKEFRNTRFQEYIDIVADIIKEGQRNGCIVRISCQELQNGFSLVLLMRCLVSGQHRWKQITHLKRQSIK